MPMDGGKAEFEEALYHITHDLRATLRAMKTVPGWIREDLEAAGKTMSANMAENLVVLETQAARADQMLLDLRSYSRVGRTSDQPCEISLASIVADAATSIGVPDSFEVRFDLGVAAVFGARNEIQCLFELLLSNAVNHHDRDSGCIEVQSSAIEGHTLVKVRDDGPGIAEELRSRVFDMMVTGQSRDVCEGSGLGLSIAKKIVTRHGGKICIANANAQRGCRVEILWPTDRSPEPSGPVHH